MKLLFSLLFIIFINNYLYAQDTLHLVIPEFKPFTYKEANELKGIGVERISKIFASIEQPIKLRLVPNYGRAVEETRQGKSDGFFLATQNKERDSIAHFSKAVFVNRWCWFFMNSNSFEPASKEFKSTARIATPINANTHKWLKNNNYTNIFPMKDMTLILPLLIEKKVDAVFIAEEVFLQQLTEKNIYKSNIKKQIESERPFGIYISKNVIERNMQLMEDINITIDSLNQILWK